MKNELVFSLCLLFLTGTAVAQTNSFPPSGNVGIGTTNPTSKLDIRGSDNSLRIWKGNGNAPIMIASDGDGTHNNSPIRISSFGYGGNEDLTHTINNYGGNYYYKFGSIDGAYNVVRITKGSGGSNGSAAGYGILEVYSTDQNTGIRLRGNGHTFFNGGNVGIGVTDPSQKLEVNGTIKTKEVNVTASGWADYVFKSGYKLMPISHLKEYIQKNGHLPNVPTESEVMENGVNLAEMNVKLLEKIEELTLYAIQQDELLKIVLERLSEVESKLGRETVIEELQAKQMR